VLFVISGCCQRPAGLGLAHIAKKRTAEVRACLQEAREIAEAVEFTALSEKIDTAFESLEQQ